MKAGLETGDLGIGFGLQVSGLNSGICPIWTVGLNTTYSELTPGSGYLNTTLSIRVCFCRPDYRLEWESPMPRGFVRLLLISGSVLQIRSTSDFAAK